MSDEKDVFRVTKELGLRLRSLRKRTGPTQKELADALKDRPDQELARKFAALALTGLDHQLHHA